MDSIASRIALRYVQKENKKTTVSRLSRIIREATGISRGKADEIADATVRSNRDLSSLAYQKRWPVNENGDVEGPKGVLSFEEIKRFLR